MEQSLDYETLRQRVTELEEKLKEYERKEARQNLRDVTKRLEKIAEMGDTELSCLIGTIELSLPIRLPPN